MDEERKEHEALVAELNDPKNLASYQASGDGEKVAFLPRLLGGFLVWAGNTLYGEAPSYLKFRAVEVIARVPYHS